MTVEAIRDISGRTIEAKLGAMRLIGLAKLSERAAGRLPRQLGRVLHGTISLEDARRVLREVSSAVSALARVRLEVGLARQAIRRALPSLLQAPRAIAALPLVELPLTTSPAGTEIRELLRQRHYLFHASRPAAVLTLPSTDAAYLKGNSRQAVRTNVRRARESGITATYIDDAAVVLQLMEALTSKIGGRRGRTITDHVEARLQREGTEFWFALDADKHPVAVAVLTVDRYVARPVYAVSLGTDSGEVLYLYLLNVEIIRSLIERGYQYIVADSALVQDQGVHYLRERLGFALVRVRVIGAS
jgi:hypothetical protein